LFLLHGFQKLNPVEPAAQRVIDQEVVCIGDVSVLQRILRILEMPNLGSQSIQQLDQAGSDQRIVLDYHQALAAHEHFVGGLDRSVVESQPFKLVRFVIERQAEFEYRAVSEARTAGDFASQQGHRALTDG